MISDPIAVFVVLAGVVYVAVQLDRQVKVFNALGSALVSILLAMALSNAGLLPDMSPTYALLASTGVSVALVLILLSVDLHSVISAGPKMLVAFVIGAVGTALGATSAALTLNGVVGPETWKLAGQYTGTYTGGGANFAFLGRAFETSADLFSAAIAADVAVTAIWLIACLSIPALLTRGRAAGEPRGAARDAAGGEGGAARFARGGRSRLRGCGIGGRGSGDLFGSQEQPEQHGEAGLVC